jgi:hypothetical protein
VRSDGTFDLHVSVEPPDPSTGLTWLKGGGDETAVFVRQYFLDRSAERPAELSIALAGGEGGARALDPDGLARDLDRAKRNLQAVFQRTKQAHEMAVSTALNRFVPIAGEALFPTPDNSYVVCWYRLGHDQVGIVRGRVPKARWFGLTLYNLWMESLDYENAVVSLNHRQLRTDADGRYEVVLSHRDVGRAPRLDTTGHLAGYLLGRALLAEGDVPLPTFEVRYERELG